MCKKNLDARTVELKWKSGVGEKCVCYLELFPEVFVYQILPHYPAEHLPAFVMSDLVQQLEYASSSLLQGI